MLLYISESILDKTVKIKLLSAEIEQKLFFTRQSWLQFALLDIGAIIKIMFQIFGLDGGTELIIGNILKQLFWLQVKTEL